MILAGMLATDEDALICDFAETYHVLDWRGLPLHLAATLAAGLRQNSRSKSAASGCKAPFDTVLLALISDRLRGIEWMLSADGRTGRNRPAMLAQALLEDGNGAESDVVGFATGEEFEAARKRFIEEAT